MGTTARVVTLQGLMALRNELQGVNAAQVRADFQDAYFRDGHGSLRRVFPKGR